MGHGRLSSGNPPRRLTLTTGARQLVVHEAAVQMVCSSASRPSLQPITTFRTPSYNNAINLGVKNTKTAGWKKQKNVNEIGEYSKYILMDISCDGKYYKGRKGQDKYNRNEAGTRGSNESYCL